MNIFLHELRSYRKSTFIWAFALSLVVIFFLSIYPAFTQDIDTTKKIFEALPPTLRKAVGIEMATFFSIFGFYSYIFLYVSLIGSVQAMNLGTGLVAKEGAGKTVDFLLSKPVTRNKVLTSKLLAAFTSLVFTNAAFILASVAAAKSVSKDPFSLKTFLLISGILFLIQMIFLSLGFLFSTAATKIKSAISVSLPTVFTFFIVAMLDSIVGAENVRYFTPFKFYDTKYVIEHGAYEPKFLILETLIVIAMVGIGYLIYNKKDIDAVA